MNLDSGNLSEHPFQETRLALRCCGDCDVWICPAGGWHGVEVAGKPLVRYFWTMPESDV